MYLRNIKVYMSTLNHLLLGYLDNYHIEWSQNMYYMNNDKKSKFSQLHCQSIHHNMGMYYWQTQSNDEMHHYTKYIYWQYLHIIDIALRISDNLARMFLEHTHSLDL